MKSEVDPWSILVTSTANQPQPEPEYGNKHNGPMHQPQHKTKKPHTHDAPARGPRSGRRRRRGPRPNPAPLAQPWPRTPPRTPAGPACTRVYIYVCVDVKFFLRGGGRSDEEWFVVGDGMDWSWVNEILQSEPVEPVALAHSTSSLPPLYLPRPRPLSQHTTRQTPHVRQRAQPGAPSTGARPSRLHPHPPPPPHCSPTGGGAAAGPCRRHYPTTPPPLPPTMPPRRWRPAAAPRRR
jgi:hypothetical protein